MLLSNIFLVCDFIRQSFLSETKIEIQENSTIVTQSIQHFIDCQKIENYF